VVINLLKTINHGYQKDHSHIWRYRPGPSYTIVIVICCSCHHKDSSSAKAKALRLGAEVVAAYIDDTESMKQVMDGAYGAYSV
jgi:hypothetical protein